MDSLEAEREAEQDRLIRDAADNLAAQYGKGSGWAEALYTNMKVVGASLKAERVAQMGHAPLGMKDLIEFKVVLEGDEPLILSARMRRVVNPGRSTFRPMRW